MLKILHLLEHTACHKHQIYSLPILFHLLVYLKKYNKWLANISINNKSVHIGTYETLKECVDARNKYVDNNKLPHQKNIWRGENV